MIDTKKIEDRFKTILDGLYPDGWEDNQHLCNTPYRVAKIYEEKYR